MLSYRKIRDLRPSSLKHLQNLRSVFIWLLVLLSTASAHADWVHVTGSAILEDGLYEQARQRAYEDALQQAVMQFGAEVKSRQKMRDGEWVEDTLSVSNKVSVSQSQLLDEYISQGRLYLKMNVEVEPLAACPDSAASRYRKNVAVLGFSLQTPSHAELGGLFDVERGIASYLAQSFRRWGGMVVHEQSQQRLFAEARNAPSVLNEQWQLTDAADIARQMGVQFVVSGVVRDLSLVEPTAFSSSMWSRVRRMASFADTRRRFVLDVFVHDGFSGSIIWQKQFSTSAEWTEDSAEAVRFDSARFAATPYGQSVHDKLQQVARLIDQQLRCQPFMTRISRVDGKTLHFSSGASSGIRPGDSFALYRAEYLTHADLRSNVELFNVKTALTVTQVHPDFGSGNIEIDPGRLNIQPDDVLIAW